MRQRQCQRVGRASIRDLSSPRPDRVRATPKGAFQVSPQVGETPGEASGGDDQLDLLDSEPSLLSGPGLRCSGRRFAAANADAQAARMPI